MENVSDIIKNELEILGFGKIKRIPKLKEAKKAYFERAKEFHPDKHMDEDENTKKAFEEEFKRLLAAYNNVSRFIIENMKEADEEDEEEILVRKEFENLNVITMNQNSISMRIPKHHTDAWIHVLKTNFGSPRNQTGTNNGLQFKTDDKVSIKLWMKKKSDYDTILIDGHRNIYINFAKNKMPELFKEVIRKYQENKRIDAENIKRKPSSRSQDCKLCGFKGTKASIKIHMIRIHSNGDIVLNIKQKNSESKRVKLPRKSKTILARTRPYFELDDDDGNFVSEIDEEDKEAEQIPNQQSPIKDVNNDASNVNDSTTEQSNSYCDKTTSDQSTLCIMNTMEIKEKDKKAEQEISITDTKEPCKEDLIKTLQSKESQTEEERNCIQCEQIEKDKTKLLVEIAEEKSKRIQTETTLDAKKKRYEFSLNQIKQVRIKSLETALNEIKKLKDKIAIQTENEKKLLTTIKDKIVKQNELEELLDTVTKKNDNTENENKTLQRLYKEECSKKKRSSTTSEEEFVDYDNISDSEEEEEQNKKEQNSNTNATKNSKNIEKNHCDQCKFTTMNKESLNTHKIYTHRKFECKECKYTTSKQDYISRHMNVAHKSKDMEGTKKQTNDFKCNKCEFKTSGSYELNIHINEAHKEDKIKCNLCDFRAKDMDILKKHHIVAMGHKENKECFFFSSKGFCKNGRFCRFMHTSKREQIQKNQRENRSERTNPSGGFSSTRTCKYRESCLKFPNCSYQHKEICRYQDMCFFKETCKYIHLLPNASTPFLGSRYQNIESQIHY